MTTVELRGTRRYLYNVIRKDAQTPRNILFMLGCPIFLETRKKEKNQSTVFISENTNRF